MRALSIGQLSVPIHSPHHDPHLSGGVLFELPLAIAVVRLRG
jgi:hypothetical protein